MDIYDFKEYKQYLEKALSSENHGRGSQTRLAKAIRCQPAFVTQVLKGTSHFSLEQAQDINEFLGHTKQTSKYFLTLVQFERAGTRELKKFFEAELMALREDSLDLKKRLTYEKTLSQEDQITYYSSWLYAALHALISVPKLRTRGSLCEHLRVPVIKVNAAIEFLVSRGLILEKDGILSPGITQIHIGKDSPLARQHHINLRHKALQSVELDLEGTLHYSSLVTLSHEDALVVRSEFTKCIERIRSVVKDSKDEAAYCYLLDFFPLQ